MRRWFPPIALGALLLFLIQPMMAKAILPTHGGAAGVWTACLVFYQCGLLAGYFYAFLLSRLPLRWQMILHALLLALSLLSLPVIAPVAPTTTSLAPELEILFGLLRTIGLPYLLLASTSPLLQSWDSHGSSDSRVFRWFAISNLGSLCGLLAYPFLIEPFARLALQQWIWTIGYLAYMVFIVVGMLIPRARGQEVLATSPAIQNDVKPSASWTSPRAILCIALAACSTLLLGAATTQMSQSGVVVPFLWVLPLTLYLASFVVCFQWSSIARPTPWIRGYWASCYLACGLLLWGLLLPIPWQIAGYALLVLTCSMACHSQLYALRPLPRHLTLYYLLIALGGALGGVFTGLLAPRIFSEYWEFHLGVGGTAILLALCELARIVPRFRTDRFARNVLFPSIVLPVLFIVSLLYVHFEALRIAPVIDRQRDFFGVVSVLDDAKANRRYMLHGKTQHGAQPLEGRATAESTLYFTPQSGIAQAIAWRREEIDRPLKIGVIGLGTGSLLVHAKSGEQVIFYEISPAVDAIARKDFLYLKSHSDAATVKLGDGRQLLSQELKGKGSQQFDVLVIDAFSGDALPMHLLTLEAIELYKLHLAQGGVIAFQITNRYLDLAPILMAAARETDRRALVIENVLAGDDSNEKLRSNVRWCLFFSGGGELPDWTRGGIQRTSTVNPWTDDFGSLWSAIR